ncbi:putative dihydroflavonol-4-reductase [Wickerhamomyces ciferrii]|uniref:Dihydroflavonol-4-reductase n=1 Tax=Wickerhamomyces ciferrii (strain ATCC 14091 / BCRC 22168 / CBS 111 / JCM 3599 / NBRC 0793 / NRRL Y-1031 F-60-10) TaxID=1206466 RepID=K0KL78_WICCF|nr:putative dihydroflavonol-4-reductase [Wickerhamomyces ciferrii]CCH46000.1 putative dihydroflavonol-4-reductase [Wickerhamomyces ciferrii]
MTKYFVTGGTGYLGQALVDDLLANGHQVLALARSDESAKKLQDKGCEVHRGDLEDLESLKQGARKADGTLHLGFIHDFTRYEECCKIDFEATKAMIEEYQGTDKPFVYTTDLMTMPSSIGVKQYEYDWPKPDCDYQRTKNEIFALESSTKYGTKTIVVRLPPSVHGPGEIALIPDLINTDKKLGHSVYLDEGEVRWSAVHKNDAASAFRLAIEKGSKGSVYHAVHDEGIKSIDLAKVISEKFKLPLKSYAMESAEKDLGFLGYAYKKNMWVSNEKTISELGWVPKELNLLEDIKQNYN